ncbi:MAG: hypothetical protein WCJ76_14070 [Comamonadaceae bacterium]
MCRDKATFADKNARQQSRFHCDDDVVFKRDTLHVIAGWIGVIGQQDPWKHPNKIPNLGMLANRYGTLCFDEMSDFTGGLTD